ncbi:hypothetical protein HF882_06865 [Victivallis vadensis]|uniref:Uncharacterized protein n=1 Tax=Victivallis vadensis TaxID=172901 RepID=A0A848AR47_9BACT|nr:hypothetical protein [Victivallis vadensis]NMD86304.1 hypothetical protein [Victivallis vadensis]
MNIQVIRNIEGRETRSRKINSRTGKIDWVLSEKEVGYLVTGVSKRDDARKEVLAKAPESEDALPLKSIRFEGFSGDEAMEFSVIYGALETTSGGNSDDEEEEPTVSFDCSGGTTHIVRSLNQRKLKSEPNPGGMIGWNGKLGAEAEYSGVDVVSATMRETYTSRMKLSRLTTAYKRMLANLTGKVNSGVFKGWKPGEVLFLGASFSGSVSGSELITVTYNFAIQQNEENVPIFDGVRVNKKGWEYLWTISRTVADPETKANRVEIQNAFVDQVYAQADFGQLKL